MKSSIRTYLTVLLITGYAFSCTEKIQQITPPLLRLKTTNNIQYGGSPWQTEYVYDPMGRVGSFTLSLGTKGVFYYDEQNRYRQIDYLYRPGLSTEGETRSYTYTADGFTVRVSKMMNGNPTTELQTKVYKMNEQGHLVSIATSSPGGNELETFEYTGNNITRQQFASGLEVRYEYDNKPNPYFGLVAPDISVIRQFSRNNIIKLSNNGRTPAEVTLTYNAEGFPLKLIEANGPGEVHYTYEPVITP